MTEKTTTDLATGGEVTMPRQVRRAIAEASRLHRERVENIAMVFVFGSLLVIPVILIVVAMGTSLVSK